MANEGGRVARVMAEGSRVVVLARRGGRWRPLLDYPATPEGERLAAELVTGFRLMVEAGEPVPPASYFATKIAEIIHASRDREIEANTQYDLYQEILLACEDARREVLGDEPVN